MPDPEDGRFQVLTPKGSGVEVGEKPYFRLTQDAELALRVQALERVISRVPFLGQDYANELKRAGLKKSNLKLTW